MICYTYILIESIVKISLGMIIYFWILWTGQRVPNGQNICKYEHEWTNGKKIEENVKANFAVLLQLCY